MGPASTSYTGISTRSDSNSVWIYWNSAFSSATSGVTASNEVGVIASNEVSNRVIWMVPYGNYVGLSIDQSERERQIAASLTAREKREKIDRVARDLLLENLSASQRARFENERVFEVVGGSRKHRYLIDHTGGVTRIDEQGSIESYCIHPSYAHRIPTPDLILAKKLMLECDEETFLRTANATRRRAG